MHFAGDTTGLFVLRCHEADGEFAKLFRLQDNVVCADFEFPGARMHLTFQRRGQIAKSRLGFSKFRFDPSALCDIASRPDYELDLLRPIEHRPENVLVIASRAGWASVLRLIDQT